MKIKTISESDAPELMEYYLRNTLHFKRFEPTRSDDFEDVQSWKIKLRATLEEIKLGKALHFIGIDEKSNRIIGHCTLSNIIYGPFMAAYMGYAIDKQFKGRGNMKSLCNHSIDHAFNKLGLHRIMANYMPCNERSGQLLKKLGFVIEGEAKEYLKINGRWEDHILTSLTKTI